MNEGLNRLKDGIKKFQRKNEKILKIHEFEDMINIELKYQKTTEEILEQFYLQKDKYVDIDFALNQIEIMTIETLLKLVEKI